MYVLNIQSSEDFVVFSKRISAGRLLINLLVVNNQRARVVKNRVMTSILVVRENLLVRLNFRWKIKLWKMFVNLLTFQNILRLNLTISKCFN